MNTITDRQLSAEDIIQMIGRVDERLEPLRRIFGFEPYEGVYRLGEWGYVSEDEYKQAFQNEPEWAEPCYMLVGNDPDALELWAETYRKRGLQGLNDEIADMFDGDCPDTIFWTQASEEGSMSN